MKVTLFCDAGSLRRLGVNRMIEAARFRFGNDADIAVATDAQTGEGVLPLASGVQRPADVWVMALANVPGFEAGGALAAVRFPGSARDQEGKKLYILEPHGLIHPVSRSARGELDCRMGSETEPYLDEHVFARIAPRTFRNIAYPFPYGGYYEALSAAFGPTNSFGFRIKEDLAELAKRPGDHFLVGVFGGSSTMSPACLQSETFSSRLAAMLDDHFQSVAGRFRKCSVLNLGTSGATVLNELITYLLFLQPLSPNVVISHDGFNDFAHALRSDPVLLNKYHITYLPEMEQWARSLMGTSQVPLTQQGPAGAPFVVRTSPRAIVTAYLSRKRQFQTIVENSGTRFVYGIQPAWFCKRLTPAEQAKMDEIRRTDTHNAPLYEHMKTLYSMTTEQLRKNPPRFFLDLNTALAAVAADEEIFVDHAHLTPAGDLHVAKAYFRRLVDDVLPTVE
jgi:hypothetical protein